MDREEAVGQKTAKELEVERLWNYPEAPYFPRPQTHSDGQFAGVLLSDDIEFYCKNFRLLDPYKPENIQAASYELRVGLKYAVSGKTQALLPGEKLRIPKFEVAVIEFLETINMPDFLIGRWNIRTRWAYEGLVWVGGPQVNPGYRGLIMAPIWNLSNRDFEISCGEALAVMDFSLTRPPTAKSNRQPLWHKRSRFVFEDYNPGKLRSGLVELVDQAVETSRKSSTEFEQSRRRIDAITGVMFTALGVLTTAVTIIVTRPGTGHDWWEPNIFFLSCVTTILALLAWLKSYTKDKPGTSLTSFVIALVFVVGGLQIYTTVKRTQKDTERQKQLETLNVELKRVQDSNQGLRRQVEQLQSAVEKKTMSDASGRKELK